MSHLILFLTFFFAALTLKGEMVALYPQSFVSEGWKLDTQFMDVVGSPYLIAHGMGRAVPDAEAVVELPETGAWRVAVRVKNWLPSDSMYPVSAKDYPGSFCVLIDGVALKKTFGRASKAWTWEDGSEVSVGGRKVRVTLRDLDGFDGRCAGVVFYRGKSPAGALDMRTAPVSERKRFDLVVVGGGVPGCCAAVAAARQGLRVALVQDRPVFGGNASSEIRVWSAGEIRHPIVREMRSHFFNRDANNGVSEQMRLAALQREPNLAIFPSHRVFAVEKDGARIVAAKALDLRMNRVVTFEGAYFTDATGDGWLGFYAGADYRYGRESRSEFGETYAPEKADRGTLGASLMWESSVANVDIPFVAPWAEPYACGEAKVNGEWNWEYGLMRDMLTEGEEIRDRLLLAIYGAFSHAKKDAALNSRRMLTMLPYVLGKRESRRLTGDWVYKESDITTLKTFEDAVATGSWSVDLHYVINEKVPFLTRCEQPHFGRYWIPYRSIYSRNVENLFMVGRCFSCTHVGLAGPRVINTLSQLGVAAGTAAAMCHERRFLPRDIWSQGLSRELQRCIGGDWPGNPDPARKEWRYVDDEDASVVFGEGWGKDHNANGGQRGNVSSWCNLLNGAGEKASKVTYPLSVAKAGRYRLLATTPYMPWRKDSPVVALTLSSGGTEERIRWHQMRGNGDWTELGVFDLEPGANLTVDPASSTGNSIVLDGFAVVPQWDQKGLLTQ